jgi:hypothetical protein
MLHKGVSFPRKVTIANANAADEGKSVYIRAQKQCPNMLS